jgi:hypothetical protein
MNIKIMGIIYLHRISDNRVAASALRNISGLLNMCGGRAMPHVFLVTTMWDEVPTRVAVRREQELYHSFWKPALDKGAKAMRFNGSFNSAWDIIDDMLAMDRCPDLLMQVEQVEQNRHLNETQAFIPLNSAPPKRTRGLKRKARKAFSKLLSILD